MNDAELIQHYGGTTATARLLGYPMPDGAHRVNNWRKRGIPASVKVQFPQFFMNPKVRAKKSKEA